MKSIVSLGGAGLILIWALSPMALARGLETLSQEGPRSKESSASTDEEAKAQGTSDGANGESHGAGASGEGATASKPLEKSELSKALQDKLRIGTSFGWIRGSASVGDWTVRGGTSDVYVEYRLKPGAPQVNSAWTYRYTPFIATGRQDGQSYKAVWETHSLGFKLLRSFGRFSPYGQGEMGVSLKHAQSTDGLPEKRAASGIGFQGIFGGGVDFAVEGFPVVLGPRVHLGIGSIRTVQVGSAFLYAF